VANGEGTVELTVTDPVGLTATASDKVKLDTTHPRSIAFSGLPAGKEFGSGSDTLKVTAEEGTASIPSAGIESIKMTIDGREVGKPNGSCSVPSGPCSATGEWTVNGSEYSAEQHTIRMIVTSYAGESAESIVLTQPTLSRAVPLAVGPASVNPKTGEALLSATDVSIAAPGGELSVKRSFDAFRPSAGAEGPLGSQWSMSVGAAQSLTKAAEGAVVMTAAEGHQSVFTSKGKGEFNSPVNSASLTLSEVAEGEKTKEFVLKGADGSATHFTTPSGGSGTLWMPSSVEGPGGTNVTTYAFATVGSITEPTKVLAPSPAGVSCATELVKGCRALGFVYSTTTTATGERPSQWGEYAGRLKEVTLTAWEPSSGKMQTTGVAEYAYDSYGRLRGEWNPTISPALETTYGYDNSSHVTAVTAPGQQPWTLTYGGLADSGTEQLLKVTQAQPKAGATESEVDATLSEQKERPTNTTVPKLSGAPVVGVRLAVTAGSWTKFPVAYRYTWDDCNSKGEACTRVPGANNANYTVASSDVGHTIKAEVTATNGGGSVQASSAASAVAKASGPEITEYALPAKSEPEGIAAGSDSNLWFTEFGTTKVGKMTPTGTITEYNGGGSEELRGITAGPDGNLWFAVEGISYIKNLTTAGKSTGYALGNGRYPVQVAAGPEKEAAVWFTEAEKAKLGKITTSGAITEYSVIGEPRGIIAGPDGNMWFTEVSGSSGKIGKTTPAGKQTYYALPENAKPLSIASGPEKENALWFTEPGIGKIGKITTAGVISQYSVPSGTPTQIAAGSDGNLWFTEESEGKVGKITTGGTITQYSLPSGSKPRGIAPGPEKEKAIWVTEAGTSKIAKLNLTAPAEGEQLAPGAGETIEYNVPVSGSSAPYALGSSEAEAWGQKDDPTQATAIFPADEPMGWPASDYKRATVYYLDKNEQAVNVAKPGGAIATIEYNNHGDVERALSPDNRAAALKEGSKSAETAKRLDTESTYSTSGGELQSTLGPEHNVELAGGTQVQARHHTLLSYEEGAPTEGGPYGLPTKTSEGAQYAGKEEDVRETTMSYAGQENLGRHLHKPTSATADPKGLKLTHSTVYEPGTGAVKETITPAGGPTEKSSHGSETIYYSTAKNTTVPACGEHPEWASLPCQSQPAKQPGTSGLPNLPVTIVTYNMWDQVEKTTETVGSSTRTTTITSDAAGRPKATSVSATVGTALPTVTDEYNEKSGALEKQSVTTEGKTSTITSVENTLGELVSYTDADGNTSTYTYDIDGRPEKVNDGKGTQTYTYEATTGEVTKLVDSAAGTFTATYDPEGNLLSEGYPNGMSANYSYSAAGEATGLEYVKTTHCTTGCTWFSDKVVPSIHGQLLEQTSTLSHQAYSYDADGRLTQVQSTPAGKGCTTRVYAEDADTNRTSLTTREPAAEGKCASEGGVVEKHTYDGADRLTDAGVSYSAFGNITTLPAADAGGSELTSAFYVNNRLQSQTQNGETIGYNLDPSGRTREVVSTGKTSQDVIDHYAGAGNAPAWTLETPSGSWTRNIQGIGGGLAAIQSSGGTTILQLADLGVP
jgi:YD repeat-containing protein